MKKFLLYPLLFGLAALAFSSCATQDMIAKAQGLPGPLDNPNQPPTNPNPAYYALIPAVLPFDLVAWPFQYAYLNNRNAGGPPPPNQGPPPGYQGPPPGYQGPPPGYSTQAPYRPVSQQPVYVGQ